MASVIRKLEVAEIPAYVEIGINAYPGVMQNTIEFKERLTKSLTDIQENVESIDLYGLFRENKLIGGMRIHYYTMNLFGKLIETGGVGFVAVDLLHKKEKVAKELIEYFISFFQKRGASLVALYPFRPDFYKKMGFGYGTKMNQYRIEPSSFLKKGSKDGLVYLNHSHKEMIRECANRVAGETHGMMLKTDFELESLFKNADNKLVGMFENGDLKGYMVFSFKNTGESMLINNLILKEMIYETPEVLAAFCTFLHSQDDQINRVIFNTQDDSFEFLLEDPRNGSNEIIPSVYHETNTSGVGLMYKIVNLEKMLMDLSGVRFGTSSCHLKLTVHDSFASESPMMLCLKVENGEVSMADESVVERALEIEIGVADFTSLLMGVVDFNKLYQYGKVKINDTAQLSLFNQLFPVVPKPLCISAF